MTVIARIGDTADMKHSSAGEEKGARFGFVRKKDERCEGNYWEDQNVEAQDWLQVNLRKPRQPLIQGTG